jgi:hypothetical protein
MNAIMKAAQFIKLLPTHPLEMYDRLATKLEVQFDRRRHGEFSYDTINWNSAIEQMERYTGQELKAALHEPQLAALEQEIDTLIPEKLADAPFTLAHLADRALARMCYAVVRATRPLVVVETGVAYGITSAFILRALDINGMGYLHSIDLPPLGDRSDSYVGILISGALRKRWTLYRGPSRRLLPRVLRKIGTVDIFVHDSLHTYKNMLDEFRIVAPHLSPCAFVLADDIEGNAAFADWTRSSKPAYFASVQESQKRALFGIACIAARQTGSAASALGALP